MTITITARHCRGVADATIEIDRLTLVAGLNGAGKSSLRAGASGAVMGAKPAEAAALLAEGAESGAVAVAGPDGKVTLPLPGGKGAATGRGVFASGHALGAVSLATMTPKERAAEIGRLLDSEPARADLDAALAGHTDDDGRERLWRMAIEMGWDGAAKEVAGRATKAKGAWEQIASEKWGAVKAENWRPRDEDGIDILDGTETPETLAEAIADAERENEAAIAAAAVDMAEAERLRREAESLPERREAVEQAKQATEAARAALAEAEKARAACEDADAAHGPRAICGECGTEHVVWKAPAGVILKPVKDMLPEKDLKERRRAIAQADGKVENAKTQLARAERGQREAEMTLGAAEGAARDAEALAAKAGDAEAATARKEAARDALAAAEYRQYAFETFEAARAKQAEIVRLIAIAAELGPEGVRKRKLADALSPFNAALAELAGRAGWRPVTLDDSLAVTRDGRAYDALSTGEQWQARSLLALAVAAMDDSEFVILDDANDVDAGIRTGLLSLIRAGGLPVLVCLHLSGPGALPPMTGPDRAYWLADGRAEPVERRAAA